MNVLTLLSLGFKVGSSEFPPCESKGYGRSVGRIRWPSFFLYPLTRCFSNLSFARLNHERESVWFDLLEFVQSTAQRDSDRRLWILCHYRMALLTERHDNVVHVHRFANFHEKIV